MIKSTGGYSICGLLIPALLLSICPALFAQNVSAKTAGAATWTNQSKSGLPDLEPAVLKALKAMSDQLSSARSLSFTARVMREEPATNGQMLDFFRDVSVQVQRPNKMHAEVKSSNSDVNIWYDGKNITLMPASAKIYTVIAAPGNSIDVALTALADKLDAHLPLKPFVSADPDAILTDGLQSANEVGFADVGNRRLLHLAFTEPDANWQLWLSGPNQILPKGMAIVYKNVEGHPRVYVDFSNWHLNAEIPADTFVFTKPAGAGEVSLSALRPGKVDGRNIRTGNTQPANTQQRGVSK